MNSETVISARDCDIRALKLSATEAFVLSRIEGKTSLEELAESLGMPFDQAEAIVRRLAELNAIVAEEPTSRYCSTFRARTERRNGKSGTARKSEPRKGSEPTGQVGAVATPKVLRSLTPPPEEAGRVSQSLERRIADLDARLDGMTDRALLGVDETAGEREIKKAFAKLANTYDPSNYFGVDMGGQIASLDRIFARLAAAQESLLTETRSIRPAAPPKPSPAPKAPTSRPARRAHSSQPSGSPRARKPSKKSVRTQAVKPEPVPQEKAAPSPPPAVPRAPAPQVVVTSPKPVVEPGMDAEAYARASEQAYRREMASRQRSGEESKAKPFLLAAQEAEAIGDVVIAAQHYRLALQINESEEVRRALGRIEHKAQTIVYETARRQGADAERGERWGVAATRYAAAYEIVADPQLAERIANALLRDGKDLRRALKLAEEAVMKDPRNALFRVTLAEVCQKAGLLTRASGEAQRARELAPADPRVRGLVERLEAEAKSGRK